MMDSLDALSLAQVVDLLVELRQVMMVDPLSLVGRLPPTAPAVLRKGLFFIVDRPLLNREFENLLDELEDAYVVGATTLEESEVARVVLAGLRALHEQTAPGRTRRLILRCLPVAARPPVSEVRHGDTPPSA